jgi:hypothetical protein
LPNIYRLHCRRMLDAGLRMHSGEV